MVVSQTWGATNTVFFSPTGNEQCLMIFETPKTTIEATSASNAEFVENIWGN